MFNPFKIVNNAIKSVSRTVQSAIKTVTRTISNAVKAVSNAVSHVVKTISRAVQSSSSNHQSQSSNRSGGSQTVDNDDDGKKSQNRNKGNKQSQVGEGQSNSGQSEPVADYGETYDLYGDGTVTSFHDPYEDEELTDAIENVSDPLVQDVLLALLHEGVPESMRDDPERYLQTFAGYGWDEEASRIARIIVMKYYEQSEQSTAIVIQDDGLTSIPETEPSAPIETIEITGTILATDDPHTLVLDNGSELDARLYDSHPMQIVGKSHLNPYIVLVEDLQTGEQIWLDIRDSSVSISTGNNLADVPTLSDGQPELTTEDIIQSFQESQLQSVEIFPIAQDPSQTEIIQFGVRNEDNYPTFTDYRHPGMDFFAAPGTEVISVTGGEVVGIFLPSNAQLDYDPYGVGGATFTGGTMIDPRNTFSTRPEGYEPIRETFTTGWFGEDSEGGYIVVRSGNSYQVYGHLDPNSIQVGTHVIAGQPIATIAQSDAPGNAHLHLEVRTRGTNAVYLDESGEFRGNDGSSVDAFKPQLYINPAHLFTESFVMNNINPGLQLRNDNNRTRPINTQGNAIDPNTNRPNALNQNTEAFDQGSRTIFVMDLTRGDLRDPLASKIGLPEDEDDKFLDIWPNNVTIQLP